MELTPSVVRPELLGARVLVTGASGFIGTRLCQSLRGAGAEVHRVSRRTSARGSVHWWVADLAEPGAAARLMRRVEPDFIFHLAGEVTGSRDLAQVATTLRGNLLTTVNLLTAACEHGRPRVLVAGSMEEPVPGDPDPVPSSPYAASKAAGTAYARMFHALYALPVVHLRIFMVYGPGQEDRTKLVPYTIDCLLRGEAPRLSSGRREVDWIYVDDVVRGMLAAAHADGLGGETVDLGSGEVQTIGALVHQLRALVGGDVEPSFGALPDRPLERRRVADVRRTCKLIAWAPTTSLDVGLARTVQWMRETSDAAYSVPELDRAD